MSFFGSLFGGGDKQTTASTTSSNTQTNTGSGLAASGVAGSVSYVSNDPGTALAALEANAYGVARSMDSVDRANNYAAWTSGKALDTSAGATGKALDTVSKATGSALDFSATSQGSALDTVNATVSGAFGAIKDTISQSTGLISKANEQFVSKLADNAGVAPQTLQQQQQAASADLLKLALFGAVAVGAILLISRNSK